MTILCPHCEKPYGPEHDDKACRRRMSRRVFFGVCIAPLAAQIAAKVAPATETWSAAPATQNLVSVVKTVNIEIDALMATIENIIGGITGLPQDLARLKASAYALSPIDEERL